MIPAHVKIPLIGGYFDDLGHKVVSIIRYNDEYPLSNLRYVLGWATGALWHSPVDVFFWHFDRATLAMYAILSVDHQLRFLGFVLRSIRVFVHATV